MKSQTNKFCSKLWTDLFINEKGDVYPCVHKQPGCIGNIYQDTIEDFYDNNPQMKEYRQKTLEGKLECFEKCSVLHKDLISYDKLNDYHHEKIKIAFTDKCNIDCIMCYQKDKGTNFISFERLIESIDISRFDQIEIEGGEALIYEDAMKFYDYCVSLGKRPSLLTNGMTMDSEWANKLAKHSTYLHISLNAATKETHEFINRGSKWETVLENIAKVQAAKKVHNSDLSIVGHMTILPQNLMEIPLFIKNIDLFGVDRIKYGLLKTIPQHLEAHPEKKTILIEEVGKELKNFKDKSRISMIRLEYLGLV